MFKYKSINERSMKRFEKIGESFKNGELTTEGFKSAVVSNERRTATEHSIVAGILLGIATAAVYGLGALIFKCGTHAGAHNALSVSQPELFDSEVEKYKNEKESQTENEESK